MSISINEDYLTDYLKDVWSGIVKKRDKLNDSNSANPILLMDPFRCFAVPHFVDYSQYALMDGTNKNGDENSSVSSSCIPKHPKTYLALLLDELEMLEMNEKNNDLYKFKQSDDLQNIHTPAIDVFKRFFTEEVRSWIQHLTGIELEERISMTASAYGYCDHLLCHDDELENRRIAYTFYLTPNWTESDGGRLDLFSSDDKLRPLDIVNSIVPAQNMLAFFEVVPKSFHQVSEVFSKQKIRWSINGWFYGAPIERPVLSVDDIPTKLMDPCNVEFDDLLAWINPDYLDSQTQAAIREQFQEQSEIQLRNFLQTERYEAVMMELSSSRPSDWKERGPWNRRYYLSLETGDELDHERFPKLSFCLRLMRSEAMYLLLSQFTNMTIHPLFQDDDFCPPPPKKRASEQNSGSSFASTSQSAEESLTEAVPCGLELRRFEPGSYTVLSDEDFTIHADSDEATVLDAQLYFTPYKWDTKHGGFSCYVEKGSSEELLTIAPCGNSLALVSSDSNTNKFVKYINRSATDELGSTEEVRPYFVDIAGIYYEAKTKDENANTDNKA